MSSSYPTFKHAVSSSCHVREHDILKRIFVRSKMEEATGLQTNDSIQKLIQGLQDLLDEAKKKQTNEWWKALIRQSLSTTNESSVFPWTVLLLSSVIAIAIFACGILTPDNWLVFEGIFMILLCFLNFGLNVANHYFTVIR